ncbi:MAG: DUF6498-containing protein [Methanomicrobiales archaeon]|nr:DUF6498-containing protein [Methanomicrobiales archaeon]
MNPQSPAFLQQLRPASLTDPLVSLLIANVITIVLALMQGWDFATVFLIYWTQSVIIGFFTVIQILAFPEGGAWGASPESRMTVGSHSFFTAGPVTPLKKLALAGFFTLHYGVFHLVYLGFILIFWFVLGSDPQALPDLLLASAIFFLNHLYSFLFYRGKEETEGLTVMDVFSRPYARIIPMHLTIVLGVFAMVMFGVSGQDPGRILVLTFLVLKTLADLWGHARKHAHVPAPPA